MKEAAPPWLRVRAHGVELRIRVAPRSSVERVGGQYGDRLRVRVTAPPVGEAANDAVVKLIARAARVGATRVRVVNGHKNRSKTLFVDDLDHPETTAMRILAAFSNE